MLKYDDDEAAALYYPSRAAFVCSTRERKCQDATYSVRILQGVNGSGCGSLKGFCCQ